MNKIFIVMLFALNMVYFNQVMASPQIDQNIIFNEEEGKPDDSKPDDSKGEGEDEGAKEEDCE